MLKYPAAMRSKVLATHGCHVICRVAMARLDMPAVPPSTLQRVASQCLLVSETETSIVGVGTEQSEVESRLTIDRNFGNQ